MVYRLEQGAKGWKQARQHFDDVAANPTLRHHYRLANVGFGGKTDWPGLQAADMVAFFTRQYLDQSHGYSAHYSVRPELLAMVRKSWKLGMLRRKELERIFRLIRESSHLADGGSQTAEPRAGA